MTVPDSSNGVQLDREAYAIARAHGHLRYEAARRAGSRAVTNEDLCRVAGRLEAEPEVQRLIATEKERIKAATEDVWDAVLATMREDLRHDDARVRRGAADFFAKTSGRYVDRHELTGKNGAPLKFEGLDLSPMLPEDEPGKADA